MEKEEIRDLLRRFCEMSLDKVSQIQSMKVVVELSNKTKIKFKKFRDGI